MELVSALYDLTSAFPDSERFGLTSQVRRAAVSIPCNIAEGAARGSSPEFVRFLRISRGSLSELETLLTIARNLELLTEQNHAELMGKCEAIGSLIEGLSRRLKKSIASDEPAEYEE